MKNIGRLLIVAGLMLSGFAPAYAQNHHYRNNGDGTVSDLDTGLMWEQKTGTIMDETPFCPREGGTCRHVHNVNNRYAWTVRHSEDTPDGPAFTDFLAVLNRDVSADGVTITGCFAGHCDWRLPTIDELKTIVGANGISVDAIFGPNQQSTYWSATTQEEDRRFAWGYSFVNHGDAIPFDKNGNFFVRAVRGGS